MLEALFGSFRDKWVKLLKRVTNMGQDAPCFGGSYPLEQSGVEICAVAF